MVSFQCPIDTIIAHSKLNVTCRTMSNIYYPPSVYLFAFFVLMGYGFNDAFALTILSIIHSRYNSWYALWSQKGNSRRKNSFVHFPRSLGQVQKFNSFSDLRLSLVVILIFQSRCQCYMNVLGKCQSNTSGMFYSVGFQIILTDAKLIQQSQYHNYFSILFCWASRLFIFDWND